MSYNIRIEKTKNPKQKPDESKLSFGKVFTDHMFVMDYNPTDGWNDPRIVPYGPLSMDPSTCVLHYGQGIFEGLKAYNTIDGKVVVFRPEKNIQRMNMSCERLCIPKLDVDFIVEAIKTLVRVDKDWVPKSQGTSLYIRPFIIATDPFLGVHPAFTYKFIIILAPSGAYYPGGINPVKIYVEDNYVRAVQGGTGYAKTMANYAISLKAQDEAEKKGYVQVLWLDGIEKKYIEEVGAMNVFFKIKGEVVTPALVGTILPGITRDSVIAMLKSLNIPVSERRITIDELIQAAQNGDLEEAFGTGTAAVISPMGELNYKGKKYTINDNKIGPVSQKLYDSLTGIQYGKLEDKLGWITPIE